jgi:hypothetical protein
MEENNVFLSFAYTSELDGNNFSATHEYDEFVPWPKLLQDFVKFLSLAYGYDISSKVALKYQPWTDSDLDRWSGPYFYRDTDEEDKAQAEADWTQRFDELTRMDNSNPRQMDLFQAEQVRAGLTD